MQFTTFVYFLLSFSFFNVFAAPLESRDVFVPPVLYPSKNAVWIVGESRYVVWNTTGAPVNITNSMGQIYLRQNGMTSNVSVASGFSILLGSLVVKVPDVEKDGDDYQLVLFGDSGNFSPVFTICQKPSCLLGSN
jgi:hypothetical protein